MLPELSCTTGPSGIRGFTGAGPLSGITVLKIIPELSGIHLKGFPQNVSLILPDILSAFIWETFANQSSIMLSFSIVKANFSPSGDHEKWVIFKVAGRQVSLISLFSLSFLIFMFV